MTSQLSNSLFQEVTNHLSPPQISLVKDVQIILSRLQKFDHISDYSFLVSPISKAYEGYLKDFFLKLHIIDQ